MKNDEILELRGQINALSQAWLHLTAYLEMHLNFDSSDLEHDLLKKTWKGHPIEPHAKLMCQQLVQQLRNARDRREYSDALQKLERYEENLENYGTLTPSLDQDSK